MTFPERLIQILEMAEGHCAWFEGLSDTKALDPQAEEAFRILQQEITDDMLRQARLSRRSHLEI